MPHREELYVAQSRVCDAELVDDDLAHVGVGGKDVAGTLAFRYARPVRYPGPPIQEIPRHIHPVLVGAKRPVPRKLDGGRLACDLEVDGPCEGARELAEALVVFLVGELVEMEAVAVAALDGVPYGIQRKVACHRHMLADLMGIGIPRLSEHLGRALRERPASELISHARRLRVGNAIGILTIEDDIHLGRVRHIAHVISRMAPLILEEGQLIGIGHPDGIERDGSIRIYAQAVRLYLLTICVLDLVAEAVRSLPAAEGIAVEHIGVRGEVRCAVAFHLLRGHLARHARGCALGLVRVECDGVAVALPLGAPFLITDRTRVNSYVKLGAADDSPILPFRPALERVGEPLRDRQVEGRRLHVELPRPDRPCLVCPIGVGYRAAFCSERGSVGMHPPLREVREHPCYKVGSGIARRDAVARRPFLEVVSIIGGCLRPSTERAVVVAPPVHST